MDELFLKISTEVIETEDSFIFNTINPWCEDKIQRKISKYDLEKALSLYFNGGSILDKIRAEIEEQVLESLSDGGDDWFAAEKVNECLEIIDKYKTEGSDKNESRCKFDYNL